MDAIQDRLLKSRLEEVPRRRWTCASADVQLLHEWCLCKNLDIFSISGITVLFTGDPVRRDVYRQLPNILSNVWIVPKESHKCV